MYYIGIDLGTSAVKLLLMRGDGRIEKVVSREYPLYFPKPGWAEQNPKDWWDAVVSGMKELLLEAGGKQVAGIGFGGQMHGLVILDRDDQVIRPAILWNDGRTGEETDYLNQVIGMETLSSCTANIAFAGFTAPKLLWLKKHEPANFARIAKIMLPKDYIAYQLSGVHSTDYSDASGMLLLDVKNRCYSDNMLSVCGIKETMLPRLFESYETVGGLKSSLCQEFGIPQGCKIAAGAGDNAAAAVGTGTVGDGRCNISLGTSGTIFISTREFCADRGHALHSFAHADGCYHLMGCMLSAASCNKWWMDEILKTDGYAREQEGIRKLGKNSVFFLPYLMGERSPHNDPSARGAFIGMSLSTAREDMTLAVLEGVAFALRDSYEVAKTLGITLQETTICGGGAKSLLWKRILANVLNIGVASVETEEGPGMGAAMLAAVACGEYSSVHEAAACIVKKNKVMAPEKELVSCYEEKYRRFTALYPALKEWYSGN